MTETRAPGAAQLAAVLLRVGVLAFGGPAAHVSMMRRELVDRRRWVDERDFMSMFAACNLIPGPSSTELALYLGYRLAGWRGLLLCGLAFIGPAMLIMLFLAWLYERFGTGSMIPSLMFGVRPVVTGIVLWAGLDLARRAASTPELALLGVATGLLSLFASIDTVLLLVAAGGAGVALARRPRLRSPSGRALLVPAPLAVAIPAGKLLTLTLGFLKVGALAFGSGYVLLPFLQGTFVHELHWLTDRQLADAVAFGQMTPGPVFTTATFLGFLFAGVGGALLATVAVFLPGFCLVPALDRIVRLVEGHAWVRSALAGTNAGVVGLIVASAALLGASSIRGVWTGAIAVVTAAVLLRLPRSGGILVAAGAGLGLAFSSLGLR